MSDINSLRTALDHVMARDFARLFARWRRLAGVRPAPAAAELDSLRGAIEASTARCAQRAALVPEIRVDETLPIAARADEIVELIRNHQVIVLAGETGSGKTTQLPKLCLAAGRGVAGLIGCTQPRRIAARSVARRVAAELGSGLGALVGFQVRFSEQVGPNALIKFMTDGILLAETQSDPWLNGYDTIILDEAHERSLNIDFLLGYLKRLLAKRRDLKLIVTSATIDTARFAKHFGDAPIVEVEGRAYPVELRWRKWGRVHFPDAGATMDAASGRKNEPDPISLAEQIVAAVDEITSEDPRGDVLIFLPGEREIRDAHLALSRRKYRESEVLALYARLSAAEQDRVFKPGPQRRIVLATNVAETSLTVPRIRYVVDSGTARVKRYSQRNQLERLHIEPISQAAADQRKGRCGRVGPGVCFRLYDEQDFAQRERYTEPDLAGVILRMLSLKLGEVADFPFIDAPTERAVGDGYRRLLELGAVDEEKRLTTIGRTLAQLPIDVALGRMLVEATSRGVLRELLVLTSFLSIQDPRERPADVRALADAAHAQFADPKSDFIGILRLWTAYSSAHEELNQSKLRDWCHTHFLSYMRMREWRELHRQLLLVTDELGWSAVRNAPAQVRSPTTASLVGERNAVSGRRANPAQQSEQGRRTQHAGVSIGAKADRRDALRLPHPTLSVRDTDVAGEGVSVQAYEAIHRCLLSGWPTQVGLKDERGQYRGTRERKFSIFPGSSVAKAPPQWLLGLWVAVRAGRAGVDRAAGRAPDQMQLARRTLVAQARRRSRIRADHAVRLDSG